MSRAGLYVASVVAAVLVAIGFWQFLPAGEEPAEAAEASSRAGQAATFQPPPAGLVSVTAAPARRGELVERITANGVAQANRLLRITAEVSGKVDEIPVREGQWVEAGELLMALDETELQFERDRSEEALINGVRAFTDAQLVIPGGAPGNATRADSGESASTFLRRMISDEGYRTIQAQPGLEDRLGGLTREDLFAAGASLTNYRVALERAELDLQRARIRAPFAGVVAGLEAISGPNSKSWPVLEQRISAGNELMLLVDPNPIRVRVEVIESEISAVHEGRRAEVSFQAFPTETFYGTIESSDPVVDAARRTLSVSVALRNDDRRLRPGMFAQVVLDTEIHEDRLLVPVEALLIRDQNRPLVFVVRDGRAQWEYIEPGLQNDEWLEILGGNVGEGEMVITSGHFTLGHDAAVNVVDTETTGGGGRP